jgi:hypothetical protein
MRETFKKDEIKFAIDFLIKAKSYRLYKCGKSGPCTCHRGAKGERRYSSYSFLTSALDEGEWSASRPGRALPPGKGLPLPVVKEAGRVSEPVWTQKLEEKSFVSAGDRTRLSSL